MKIIQLILLFAVLFISHNSWAQKSEEFDVTFEQDITVDGKISVTSTTQGSTPYPVMTETQRDAIVSPVAGQTVYNSTTGTLNIHNGSLWKSAGGGLSDWATAFNYAVGDVVIESDKIYQANTAHTSTVFASDIANWTLLSNALPIELSTDVSGVLPMANGGTDKALTPVLGGTVYTDAGSMEVLPAGTSGQVLGSTGASAPQWVNKSISGKAESNSSVTVEEIQFKNKSLVQTASGKYLHDDSGVLYDGGFESSTFLDGWTCTGTSYMAKETSSSLILEGKASLKTFCADVSGCECHQDFSTNSNLLGSSVVASAKVVSTSTTQTLKICARVDGVTSTTDCVETGNGVLSLPFLSGTTSVGVSLFYNYNASPINMYTDKVKLEFKEPTQMAPYRTNRVKYTPIFTGFGTVSTHDCYWEQDGPDVLIDCTFVTGAVTSVEARVGLPSGMTIISNLPTISKAGNMERNVANASYNYPVLKEAGVSYLTFGAGDVSRASLTKVTASAVFGSGDLMSFLARVPIQGFQASVPVVFDRCNDQRECVTSFAGSITSGGAKVAGTEPLGFITGSCSTTGTQFTCPTTGLTVTPTCTGSHTGAVNYQFNHVQASSTPTSQVFRMIDTATGTASLQGFNFECDKQGVDLINSLTRQIVGSFKNHSKTEITSGNGTDDFSFVIGGNGAPLTTNCTSSPCGVLQIGNYVSAVTRSGTSIYPTTFSKTYSVLICELAPYAQSALQGPNGLPSCQNCNSLNISLTAANGSAYDTRLGVHCKGQY